MPVTKRVILTEAAHLVQATRRRRALPETFLHRVFAAQEYALGHQGLGEDECSRRRHHLNGWLDHLRQDDNYDRWCQDLRQRVAARDPQTPEEQGEAQKRAEALLRGALSKKQLRELDRRDYFHVVVGERRFRITRGRSHNIMEVDARGRILQTLCAHPSERVPDADTMLAQKLWLESKPDDFFKIANVLRGAPGHRRRGRLGPSVVNTRDIERLALDRVADEVHRQQEEARARQEWEAAEQDMTLLEEAATGTPAGVDPQPEEQVPQERAA